MGGLFWRVFFWYVGTTLIILGIGLAALTIANPEAYRTSRVPLSPDVIASQAENAVKLFEHSGRSRTDAAFSNLPRRRYLFDASGRQIAGAPAPQSVLGLLARVRGNSVEFTIGGSDGYAATSVDFGGKRYLFARELPQDRPLRAPMLPVWARIALGLFTAGFFCLLFLNFVSKPLRQMRAVTREFAAGDLAARVGKASPFNRRDEFADLARDFDNMASQIQNLVNGQQRLLGDISHELRSPLTRLQLALEIARRKAGPNAAEPLDRIEQEAERLNTLIGQILRSVKIDVGPASKKLFDLSNLVREVAADADFEASAQERHVRVGASEIALVHGDRDLLRSAIENVVRNAIRYTPAGSDVRIDLERNGNNDALIRVRDQGPGVPDSALPHLFEPFYRVNEARDRDSGGAGLGLAITAHVIAAHGGKVDARNFTSGGFEVRIELPTMVPEARSLRFRKA